MTSEPWRNVAIYNGPLPGRVSETVNPAGVTDADLSSFRRITGGDRPDTLDYSTFVRYQRLAAWLYYANPLARRLADIPTEMVLGGGINIELERSKQDDPEASQIKDHLDQFVFHPANGFNILLPGLFTMLNIVHGELFIPTFTNPYNGDVGLGLLEHSYVQDVILNPNNRLEAVAVIQKPPTPGSKPLWWNVIRPVPSRSSDNPIYPTHPMLDQEFYDSFGGKGPVSFGDLVTAFRKQGSVYPDFMGSFGRVGESSDYDYAGELLYFRSNVLGVGRGRSALEPVLDWIHAYDNFLFGDLRSANLQSAFVWDVTVTGASGPELKKKASDIKQNPPRPGEVRVHNEKETWKAESPSLSSASHSELGAQVKKIIGLGLGIPAHLVGAEDTAVRTAMSSDVPFLRRMENRQTLAEHVIRTILDYQIDQKRHAGVLKPSDVATWPYPYRIVLPSLTAGELLAQAEALFNITQSLVTGMGARITSLSEARRIWYAYGVRENNLPDNLDEQVDADSKAGRLPPIENVARGATTQPGQPGSSNVPTSGPDMPRKKQAKSTSGAPTSGQRGR